MSHNPLGRLGLRSDLLWQAKPISTKLTQTMYDVNHSAHHFSEKYSADARLKKSNATKFRTVVIASPSKPMVLNAFMFSRAS